MDTGPNGTIEMTTDQTGTTENTGETGPRMMGNCSVRATSKGLTRSKNYTSQEEDLNWSFCVVLVDFRIMAADSTWVRRTVGSSVSVAVSSMELQYCTGPNGPRATASNFICLR